ncbi:RNA recognition motif domain-containing protein [Chitinilyticum litopenaei]|uniref:RNA recognition motif domain-containing protein n=1 Tax=Chitinilyticum litopenaei TaxID=1121276 RepID=UPI0003FF98B0|nr:RNA-binding protein [Chitinilyticum litopenaei]
MQIMITNLPPDTDAEGVAELLHKDLGLATARDIVMAEGNGERIAALFSLDNVSEAAVHAVIDKLNGFYWQGRTLGAAHATMFKD